MAARTTMCVSLIRGICGISSLPARRSSVVYRSLATAASKAEDNGKSAPESEKADSNGPQTELSEECQKKIAELEQRLTEQADQLKAQMKEVDDKYKRSLAETENVRQRMKKQIEDAKLFGIQGFCKDLLEVADVLHKATESVPQEQLTGTNPHLTNLYEGLNMTNTELKKVFTRHGLVQIDPPEGEKFDPHIHEALFQQPAPGKQGGTIAVVTKVGYKLHDRTIRPALVGVFK